MVEKIEAGKKYRFDLNKSQYRPRLDDIKKYSNNGVVLLSSGGNFGGTWKFKKENGEMDSCFLYTCELLPLREEAFLEIFKEEINETNTNS